MIASHSTTLIEFGKLGEHYTLRDMVLGSFSPELVAHHTKNTRVCHTSQYMSLDTLALQLIRWTFNIDFCHEAC